MRRPSTFLVLVLAGLLTACGGGEDTAPRSAAQGGIRLGFSQVGAESAWRLANTASIEHAATNASVQLDLRVADGKQDNQIAAIREFIAAKVDVIAFSPVVESGWDKVLQEAKDAGIPVIVTDRTVDTTDTSLFATVLGSDFTAEGRKAGEWLVEHFRDHKGPVQIVEIEGTTGSAPANQRRTGFADAIKADTDLKVIDSRDGNFTRAGGEQVMSGFLQEHSDIDVLFAHNDDAGLGAVKAIEAVGKRPGEDIKIITVDASRDGLSALAEGRLNYVIECNPLLGPQLMELVGKVKTGQSIPRRVVVDETTFDREAAKAVLPNRQY
ncbi:LacI family transcriptional regulator [Actinoplanes philippinensis]|uniref:Simple sugar transport system substrate-binding protein n=1 Tax=Actinoplanes philippinensis TaxID=35752 RepID=A0A1I2IV28_9ACTN|nr:ABC transporter substrate-binding protein [Actinoplanes philippinensis]GIE78948.1 LacI family transcriptional regulator [Actinoplanes philippinensis]SFF45528.1 simple sugar transport system substrate-binding protein [Actinoplanes philippinensis]